GIGKSIPMREGVVRAGERSRRSPVTHRDEFPAEYSLAGCSPAEPASASSAALILKQKPPVRQCFPANGNCPRNGLSHFVPQCILNCPNRSCVPIRFLPRPQVALSFASGPFSAWPATLFPFIGEPAKKRLG